MPYFSLHLACRYGAALGGAALLAMPALRCAAQAAPTERDITKPARWAVMTGTDADIMRVKASATPTTVTALLAKPRPALSAPGTIDPAFRTHRAAPVETTLWSVAVTLVGAQSNDDGDYHLVMRDAAGHVLTGELPDPARMEHPSRFAPQMRAARATLVRRLHPGEQPKPVSVPVQITGLGYWGRVGKGPGAAGSGIQLHPITGIQFR